MMIPPVVGPATRSIELLANRWATSALSAVKTSGCSRIRNFSKYVSLCRPLANLKWPLRIAPDESRSAPRSTGMKLFRRARCGFRYVFNFTTRLFRRDDLFESNECDLDLRLVGLT